RGAGGVAGEVPGGRRAPARRPRAPGGGPHGGVRRGAAGRRRVTGARRLPVAAARLGEPRRPAPRAQPGGGRTAAGLVRTSAVTTDRLGASDEERLVGAAAMAPSLLNTQPWRFEVTGRTVDMYADPARQ